MRIKKEYQEGFHAQRTFYCRQFFTRDKVHLEGEKTQCSHNKFMLFILVNF